MELEYDAEKLLKETKDALEEKQLEAVWIFSKSAHFYYTFITLSLAADAVEDADLRLQLFRHVCSTPDMSEAMSADSLHVL